LQRQRAAQRLALPTPRQNVDAIGLQLLAFATTVTTLTERQVGIDAVGIERHTVGKTVDQSELCFTVRFASRPITQHELMIYGYEVRKRS